MKKNVAVSFRPRLKQIVLLLSSVSRFVSRIFNGDECFTEECFKVCGAVLTISQKKENKVNARLCVFISFNFLF